MKYAKSIIILLLAIFLFSITSVSASEMDNTIVSTDTSQMELSINDELSMDNLQTNDEFKLTGTDENLNAQNDIDVLSANDNSTYSELSREISKSGPVKLKYKYYIYDDSGEIGITEANKVIDGNGAVIDMKGAIRAFYIPVSGVTIKNLTIKNGNMDYGAAIYFTDTGTVINCNFINNKATANDGGAIWMYSLGSLINCTFTNNTAPNKGGAVYFAWSGTLTNCNFNGNTADSYGGAVCMVSGTVTNCTFTNNTSPWQGGAIWTSSCNLVNCSFTDNTASYGGAIHASEGDVKNCNFTNNYGRTMSAIWMYSGSFANCNFANNKGSLYAGGVWMNTGRLENCSFTNNTGDKGGAACFDVRGDVINCNFTNNYANGGGAIYSGSCEVINCNFNGNNATYGSAIYFNAYEATSHIFNSTFLNNRANAADTPFELIENENHTEIIFKGRDNLINAICSEGEVIFTNVTYWGAKGIVNTDSFTPVRSKNEAGQNITVRGLINGNIIDTTGVTDENGKIVLDGTGDYWIVVRHERDTYYTECETTFTNMELYVNVTSFTSNNRTVNITAKSNIKPGAMPGNLLFILQNGDEINATFSTDGTFWAIHTFDDYDVYRVNASYIGIDNVNINNGIINITRADSTIILDDIDLTYGDLLNVTVETEGATGITAKIDDVDVSVDNYTITISGLSGGNHNLTVTTIPDADHNAVSKTVKITVNKKQTEIILTNQSVDLKPYQTVGDLATLNPAEAGKLIFVSSNETVATVDDKGNITSWEKGTAIITVSFAGNENYTAAESNITVNVSLTDASVSVENRTVDLKAGEDYNIIATTDPIGLSIDYESSNTTVAYVTSTGIIKAGAEGTAIITLIVGNGRTIAYNSTTINVTVSLNDASISVENSTMDLYVGDNFTIVATTVPSGLDVTYIPDDSGVVSIDDKGVVTALKEGIANITVKIDGNGRYFENSTTVTVTAINKVPTEISIATDTIDLKALENTTAGATLTPAEAGNLTYNTSDVSVAKVIDGTIYAVGAGQAIITVSFAGNGKYAAAESKTINVTVTARDASVNVTKTEYNLNVGEKDTIIAIPTPKDLKVSFTTDEDDIVSIDENGTITALKEGNATIYVSVGDNVVYKYDYKLVDVAVSLNDASVSVENTTVDLVIDNNFTIVATTTPEGLNVTYIPDDSGVVSVDANGVVTALKAGTANITVKVGGDGVYVENTTTVTVNVIKANVTISIEADDVAYPDDVVVTIKSDVSGNYSLFLDTTSPQYIVLEAGVTQNVTFKGLDAGTYEFTVALPESDKYNAARKTVNVTVNKADTELYVAALDTEYPNSVYGWVVTDCNDIIKLYVSNGMELNITVDTVEIFGLGALDVGEYNITAVFNGNENYNPVSNTTTFQVTKGNITFVIWTNGTSFIYTDTIVISHTLTEDATGTIKYYLQNGTFLGEESVSENFTLPALDCGEYLIIGNYSGDQHYSSVISILNLTIDKAPNTVVVTVDNTTYGTDALITVTADADGTYLVEIDGTVYDIDVNEGLGFKSIGLDAGNYSTKTTFDADNYDTKITEANFEVKKANNNITIVVDDSTYGLPYSFYIVCNFDGEYTANINDIPVNITVNDGIGFYDAGILDAGDYNVSIDYHGDKNINPSYASAAFTIFKADVNVTITAVDVTYPSDVVVTIESDVAGNYSLFIGTSSPKYVVLEAGVARDVTYEGLNAGTYEFAVALPESDNYNAARETVNVTVNKVENTTISVEVDTPVAGENATVTVTLPADATGTVEVKYGNGIYIALVVDGTAVVSVPTAIAGTETASVTYSGDTNYDPVSTEVNITVKPQGKIIAEDIKRGVNSSYDYYATLVNAEGQPISDVEITFTIDGKTYKAKTNASGIATVSAGLEVVDGKDTVYDVTVTNPYTKENTTATTTIVPRLIVVSGDLTADYLENPPYIVQTIGDDGEHVGANVTVRIVFAGFYYDLQTNETGHVVRTIGLAPGSYAVRGEYLGYKTEQTPFQVLQILQASSGTLKKTAKSYTLKATLKHTNGKAIAGQTVKLIFNGKTYTAKTNSKGVASYTIKSSVINKLKAGKTYVLKAQYVNDITKGKWQGKIKVVKK